MAIRRPPVLSPPPGYYDPNLDSQLSAAQRGMADTEADAATQSSRDFSDYGITREDIVRNRDRTGRDLALRQRRGWEDLGEQEQGVHRQSGRALSDLLRARTRAGEDYGRNVQGLDRQYGRLANTQSQGFWKSGTAGGGGMAQAMRKRQENQAWDREPIDRSFRRFGEDSAQSEARLGEDKQLSLSGIGRRRQRLDEDTLRGMTDAVEDADRGIGRAGMTLGRRESDRASQVQRGQRELGFFGDDIAANRFFQARQAGWAPDFGEAEEPSQQRMSRPRRTRRR